MSKSTHIQEIAQQRESWLQAIWAHQVFDKKNLRSTDGEKIEIGFPGWLNKGIGPDFHDARIVIGDRQFHGSVEVHLQSSAWHSHKHQQNPAYNSVILHIVLDQNTFRPIEREDGIAVAELELRARLRKNVLSMLADENELLERYDHLPGRCGMMVMEWGAMPLEQLLGHAAENRMQRKVDRVMQQWDGHAPEQILFQLIFKTLGYSSHSNSFEELAQLYPLSELYPLLQQPYRVARTEILSRWFGACDLFSRKSPRFVHSTLRKEYHQWQETWLRQSSKQKIAEKFMMTSRPQNLPERRLIGMFHHLYRLSTEGLLKGWLKGLTELESVSAETSLKKKTLERSSELFATPDWEIWQSFLGLPTSHSSSSAQLIGKDRQLVIWANAIIPFFLAYARHQKWIALEKLLFRLFLVLPAESANNRTRFMEKRLLPFPAITLKHKTLRIQQGLLQIREDFCQSFDQGCRQCQLLHFLEQFHRDQPSR